MRYEIELEVLNGATPASAWQSGNGDRLIDLALTHRCAEWQWRTRDWGVVLDLAFEDEADWLRFRANPGVQAIFDAIPDPVNGLIVHRGWGGAGGTREPRTPRPIAGAGAAELPIPEEDEPPVEAIGWFDDDPGERELTLRPSAVAI